MPEKKTEIRLDKGKIKIGKTSEALATDALVKQVMNGGFATLKKADQDKFMQLVGEAVRYLRATDRI